MAAMRPVLMPSPLVDDAASASVVVVGGVVVVVTGASVVSAAILVRVGQLLHITGQLVSTGWSKTTSVHFPAYVSVHSIGSV